jgi:hypothetical protein
MTAFANQVRADIADLVTGKKGDDVKDALSQVHRRSQDLSNRLRKARDCRRVLKEAGLDVGGLSKADRDACSSARTKIRSVASRILTDDTKLHGQLTAPSVDDALRVADRTASRLLEKTNTALEAEQARLRPLDVTLPIPQMPGSPLDRVKLQRARERFLVKAGLSVDQMLAEGPAACARRLDDLREAASVWAELRPRLEQWLDKEPPAVQRFIRAAASDDGAPLALLTNEVHLWLEAHGLLDSFAVHQA